MYQKFSPMQKTIHNLYRSYFAKKTLGYFLTACGFKCCTIELPWLNNQKFISCIPEGLYKIVVHQPNKKYKHGYIQLLNVTNRSGILIHIANYVRQILGCIAPGKTFKDINGDGIADVTHSGETMTELVTRLKTGDYINIQKADAQHTINI